MEFFDAVKSRRSVRVYTDTPVPSEVMNRAIDAALIAPNSSNMQTWGFYWVKSTEKKKSMIEACLNQSAARTAQEILVIVARPQIWKQNQREMLRLLKESQAPKFSLDYYGKLIPFMYGFRLLAPLKWIMMNGLGLFRPMSRRPWSSRDLEEVSIKSAALAAENFMLAISAQGFSTCPMEGFDESRVKRILGLGLRDRVVMAISVGEANAQKGLWGPQVRFDRNWFVHEV